MRDIRILKSRGAADTHYCALCGATKPRVYLFVERILVFVCLDCGAVTQLHPAASFLLGRIHDLTDAEIALVRLLMDEVDRD